MYDREKVEISVVLPVFNEEDSIETLHEEIVSNLKKIGVNFEIIWIDDSSTDNSLNELRDLPSSWNKIHSHTTNLGQSSALMTGIAAAKGTYIVTMDSDLQNDPEDIPSLYNKIVNSEFDVVCGYRENRKDTILRRKLSLLANMLAQRFTGVKSRDLGCTLRIMKKSALGELNLMGEMHRVLIIYLHLNGAKITELRVNHRVRIFGSSKYGYNRIFKFIFDLIFAIFYVRFRNKPLYYFGFISIGVFSIGLTLQIVAVLLRILEIKKYFDSTLIVSGFLLQVSSFTYLSIGLMTEIIIRQNNPRKSQK